MWYKRSIPESDLKVRLRKKRWQSGPFQVYFWFLWSFFNGYRFFIQRPYRARVIQSWRFGRHYHQFSTYTLPNRYPDLFALAQAHFAQYATPKLLSFGCSTGEEISTLARYIPHATLVGVDINQWCLRQAKRKFGSNSTVFYHSLSDDFRHSGEFDAIFCMAVFQHPENRHNPNRTESAAPFLRFEEQLLALDQKLKPGGLLFIDHCDFDFRESCLMTRYRLAPFDRIPVVRQRPLFNKYNQKIADRQLVFRVYEKIEN
ncbi:class I SAM-dependent methyltransferase [Arundinibacter roseus]|uniref:Class I SAM-dependent methyltransferase n=1 Tax=Arundinibacter roseus TaxID=2070510 RepID=A0A4R4K3A0_9BACT|nr:class I SAM-dependent methyltransferase [Arundinibacter roseus]TDB61800.1 class I SAM-dependent methyltransferase [Arundinibacter roseus]